jgi:hypothetical protein
MESRLPCYGRGASAFPWLGSGASAGSPSAFLGWVAALRRLILWFSKPRFGRLTLWFSKLG